MSIDGAESEEDAQELSFYALRSARRQTQPPSTARARTHPNLPHVRAACMRAPARVTLSQAACSPLTARARGAHSHPASITLRELYQFGESTTHSQARILKTNLYSISI